MQQPIRHLPNAWKLILLMIFGLAYATTAAGSSLLYKNYVIRYDRGWDILCEPYVVKKNDWVLKIFRQKGEIAHQNFRDFLGIFQRLNPHIKNIDMVRPGQAIDIPLRKLEHGTLPGQDSGVVTIPFVTLAKVTEVVKQHSQEYRVQKGDTVSRLLARKYGRFGSKSYLEGVKLFQAANPQVKNLDLIYAGQKVYLPDPSIRQQSWYDAMHDEKGNLRQTLDQGTPPTPAPRMTQKAIPVPRPQQEKPIQGNLAEAAATIGGRLHNKGTYYLPRDAGEEFELDLSRHPVLELQGDSKLAFTHDERIMEMKKEAFEKAWQDIKVVSIDDDSSVQEILSAIFEALEDKGEEAAELTFDNQGVHVAVRAKWVRPESDGRHLCITPINSLEEQTPEAIRRYLEQNGIVLKEVLPGGHAANTIQETSQRHAVKNVLALAPTSQKDFVQTLARTLGFTYAPKVSITFPYAGIQVKAYADLISTGKGQEVLVDFGDLYGDAVEAIGKTGLNVVQITAEDVYSGIVKKLFTALAMNFAENPTFLAIQRPGPYNTVITIAGVLYDKTENERILLSGAYLHPAVSDLLTTTGIDLITW